MILLRLAASNLIFALALSSGLYLSHCAVLAETKTSASMSNSLSPPSNQGVYQLMPDTDMRTAGLTSKLPGKLSAGAGDKSVCPVENLRMLEHSAELAVKNNQANAMDLLLNLAVVEAGLKFTDRAVAHARQAIDLYDRERFVPLFHRNALIALLVAQDKQQEAAVLLKEAAVKAGQVAGHSSRICSAQYLLLFDFYVWQKERTQALLILDEILSLNPLAENKPIVSRLNSHCSCSGFCNEGEILYKVRAIALLVMRGCYSQGLSGFPVRKVLQFSEQGKNVDPEDLEFGLVVLSKVLARQREVLKTDDERLVATFVSLGIAYGLVNKNIEARKNFQEALRIAKIYQPEVQALQQIGTDYEQVLKKLEDSAELERLANLRHDTVAQKDSASIYPLNQIDPNLGLSRVIAIHEAINRNDFHLSEELVRDLEKFFEEKEREYAQSSASDDLQVSDILNLQYLRIAKAYLNRNNLPLARLNLLKGLVSTRSGDEFNECYSQYQVFELVDAFVEAGEYDEAVGMMKTIIPLIERDNSLIVTYGVRANIKLSEVLIRQSRNLNYRVRKSALLEEAKNVFEKGMFLLSSHAEIGSGKIERETFIHKIFLGKPALVELNFYGPVEYHDDEAVKYSDASCGLYITGINNIQASERADGGYNVCLDGKDLPAIAGQRLDKGNLPQAFHAVLAGLRARPDSPGFAVLGEYWYIQGEYAKALQACDESLELDSKNYYALGVRAIVNAKLGNRKQAEKDAKAVLDGLKTVTTTTDKLTKAFALMVLSDYDGAIALLSELNEPESKSWRALFFRQQCYEVSGKKDLAAADADLLKQWQGKFEKTTN